MRAHMWIVSRVTLCICLMVLIACAPSCFTSREESGGAALVVSPTPYFWVDRMPSLGPRDAELRLALDLHVINQGDVDVEGFRVYRVKVRSISDDQTFTIDLEPVRNTSPVELIPAHSDVLLHYAGVTTEPADMEEGTMLYGIVDFGWGERMRDEVAIPPIPLEYTY
ncbi:hypothetical protein AMJ71_06765 [candidate division TA06 bacterium SM1_40]|jgi:hypothetical protein|uniref:Late embryogenesis abundant protein LEA-2 subgroup domain-containing protein n=2 Tax=Bacteria division TA06 TaxID=1156500 RepID=A0A0S8JI40_UNCT6|nr:MAG: hypothetical protein AMJ82_01390 [candidate division TA06 bacterium SM23_40]KPL09345.1 MAG: hypothetical protein AMJ71_06765 [candidate division TA06 bacterium SM1_40]